MTAWIVDAVGKKFQIIRKLAEYLTVIIPSNPARNRLLNCNNIYSTVSEFVSNTENDPKRGKDNFLSLPRFQLLVLSNCPFQLHVSLQNF